MDRLGIEFITVLGQDPVDFVNLSADLGAPRIGLALAPVVTASDDTPRWSMRDDADLYARVRSAITGRNVTVMLGEGFLIHPQMDIANAAGDMDLLAGLGTQKVNIVGLEPDTGRCHDQFALFAAMAAERGMGATIEFMPGVAIDSLAKAEACVRASGLASAGILLDSMHFFASGATVGELAALDPALIGHAQICDLAAIPPLAEYANFARWERLAPGDGSLPLCEFVKALPADMLIGLEVPQRSLALTGHDHRERLMAILTQARSFTTGLL